MKRVVNKKLKELDLKFGGDNELVGKQLIEEYLDMPLRSYKDKYSTFDFYNNEMKVIVELKSRRNDSKKYETQLIGLNKIKKAKEKIKDGYIVYLFWLLSDGLYVYKVSANHMFKTSQLGNYARGDKPKELCLIPNDFLKKTIPKEEQKEDGKKEAPFILTWD